MMMTGTFPGTFNTLWRLVLCSWIAFAPAVVWAEDEPDTSETRADPNEGCNPAKNVTIKECIEKRIERLKNYSDQELREISAETSTRLQVDFRISIKLLARLAHQQIKAVSDQAKAKRR